MSYSHLAKIQIMTETKVSLIPTTFSITQAQDKMEK